MNKLAIVFAVGAAALLGFAANAADNTVRAKAVAGVSQRATDFGSQGRYHRGYGQRGYRPRYGYGPRPYYGRGYGYGDGGPIYGRSYGDGGPSISFGFGDSRATIEHILNF